MARKHPLTAVAKLCDEIRPAGGGAHCLYAQNHKLHISQGRSVSKDSHIIAWLNSSDINLGLTKTNWDKIDAKIRTLKKQGVL